MHGPCFACEHYTYVSPVANGLLLLCTPCVQARIPACAPMEHTWPGTTDRSGIWVCPVCSATMTSQAITFPAEEPKP
jgi:hypothetical protein